MSGDKQLALQPSFELNWPRALKISKSNLATETACRFISRSTTETWSPHGRENQIRFMCRHVRLGYQDKDEDEKQIRFCSTSVVGGTARADFVSHIRQIDFILLTVNGELAVQLWQHWRAPLEQTFGSLHDTTEASFSGKGLSGVENSLCITTSATLSSFMKPSSKRNLPTCEAIFLRAVPTDAIANSKTQRAENRTVARPRCRYAA